MNRRELLAELEHADVAPYAYSLFDSLRDECYCLLESATGFTVFYAERGNRNEEREFASESEACEYFLEHVLRDPTTRRRGVG